MSLSKREFANIKIGDMVKDARAGDFKAVEQIDSDLLILSTGYVLDRTEMLKTDVQARKEPMKQTAQKKKATPSVEANAGAELMSRYPKRSNEILRLVSKGFTVSQIEASFVMEDAGKKVRR